MPQPLVIDLSHHNANVDFGRIRAAGVVGIVHKATQGVGFLDPKYRSRKQPAVQAGLLWGAYHFGTGDDVGDQVDHFLDFVQPDGSFLLVLDFEKNEPSPENSMSLAQAKQFLTLVEQRTRQHPTVYTGSYMNDVAGPRPDPDLARYRVWWARYSDAPTCTLHGQLVGFGSTATAITVCSHGRSMGSGRATATPLPAAKQS